MCVASLNDVDIDSVPNVLDSPGTPGQGCVAVQKGIASGCGCKMPHGEVVVLQLRYGLLRDGRTRTMATSESASACCTTPGLRRAAR